MSIASILAITTCLADEDKVLAITAWTKTGYIEDEKPSYDQFNGNPLIIRADGSGDFFLISELLINASIPKGTFIGEMGVGAILQEITPHMSAEAPTNEDIFFHVLVQPTPHRTTQNGIIYESSPLTTLKINPTWGYKASPPKDGFIKFANARILTTAMLLAQQNFYAKRPEQAREILIQRPPYPGIPEPPSVEEIRKFSREYYSSITPIIRTYLFEEKQENKEQIRTPLYSSSQDSSKIRTTSAIEKRPEQSISEVPPSLNSMNYIIIVITLFAIIAIVVYLIRKKNKNRPQS